VADKSDKTEQPTARHKKEVRKGGSVARSTELGAWACLLLVGSLLPMLGGRAAAQVVTFFHQVLGAMSAPSAGGAVGILGDGLGTAAVAALPVVLGCTVVGLLFNFGQVGLRFTPRALAPKGSRISPRAGLKRIFSSQGVWNLAKTLAKLVTLALVGLVILRQLLDSVLGGATLPLPTTMAAAGGTVTTLFRQVGAVALVIAAGDYAFQRRQYQQNLRMSKQEIRDELRREDGAPEIRRALRRKARDLSRMRMMAAIAGADVVLTNPTHYAVAIAYDQGVDRAPRVVAKGADVMAARIRERARTHRVPIVENPPLARALHAACEVDDVVPPRMYEAVAQLLAFVYSLSPAAKVLQDTHRMRPSALRVAS
jgi:flagellar biosynthesis protein FlhB